MTNILLLLLIFCNLLPVVLSIYKSLDIWESGQWATTLVSNFGMARGGLVNINYNIRPMNSSMPYNSYLLLVLVSNNQRMGWYSSMPMFSDNHVITNGDKVQDLCNKPSLYRAVVFGTGSLTYTIPNDADVFSLYALQCVTSNDTPWLPSLPTYENSDGSYSTDGDGSVNSIGVSIDVFMVNIRPNAPPAVPIAAAPSDDSLVTAADTLTKHVSHLSINNVFLPRMYTGFIILHLLLLVGLMG